MNINKVSTLFVTFIIAISVLGVTYAHWSDNIRIIGTAKMAHIKMTTISDKCLTSKDVERYSEIKSYVSDDGHLYTIEATNVRPCWFIWIGLKLQNAGSLPANVKPIEYGFDDPDGFHDYFETTEYFYGPYPEAEGPQNPIHNVWRNAKVGAELLEDGTVTFTETPRTPPFPTDPYEKVIVWIWVHCKLDIPDDAQGKTITMYIYIVDDLAV